MPVILARLAAALVLLTLAGCGSVLTESTSVGAGVAGAAIASAVTKNGTVTAAIGLGVASAAATGLQLVERRVHAAEQNEIAAVAGTLKVGAVGSWAIAHDIPIEADEHGRVTVSRDIAMGELRCREIVFSVEHPQNAGVQQDFYVTDICRDGTAWKWASAEPSTARWGFLQ